MNELYHHGILGQKWGVRRYQNADGSLTAAGRRRAKKDAYKKWGESENRPSSVKTSLYSARAAVSGYKNREVNKKLSDSIKADSDRHKAARDYRVKMDAEKARKEAIKAEKAAKKNAIKEAKQVKKEAKLAKKEQKLARKEANDRSKVKDPKKMTDEELRNKINRLQLEKQYYQLTTPEKKQAENKAAKFVTDIFESGASNIGKQLSTYMFGTMVNKVAGKEIVNPKKGQKDK